MAPRSAAAGGVADAHRASGPRASSFEAPRWSFFLSRPPLERAQEPSFLFQWAPQSPSDCAVPMRYHGAQERGSGGRGKVLVPRLGDGWVHCAHGAVVCVVELPSCCCPPGTRHPPINWVVSRSITGSLTDQLMGSPNGQGSVTVTRVPSAVGRAAIFLPPPVTPGVVLDKSR